MGIEEMLDELAKIGQPRLSRLDSGAWCAILKFPAPEGITAEVKSDFDHPTHRAALECLMQRLDGMRRMVSALPPPKP